MEKNDLFEFLKDEQKSHQEASEKYRRDANNIFFELPKHLILTATVFIALSSSVLALQNVKTTLACFEKYILVSSIALIVFSIFIGLLQYVKDYNFFKERVMFSVEINRKIKKKGFNLISEYDKEIDERKKKLKIESAKWPLITQSILLLFGVLGFLFFIYMVLF